MIARIMQKTVYVVYCKTAIQPFKEMMKGPVCSDQRVGQANRAVYT